MNDTAKIGDRIEPINPDIVGPLGYDTTLFASIAISLKRIADALERPNFAPSDLPTTVARQWSQYQMGPDGKWVRK